MTVDEVAAILQARGLTAEIETDDVGDPMIRSRTDGSRFLVYFYECDPKRRCGGLEFWAGFDFERSVSLSEINDFNAGHRYAKAYLEDQDVIVTYDLDVERGATAEMVDTALALWETILPDFKDHLGWNDDPGEFEASETPDERSI